MTETKMIYLIKRRPSTSREELVAHWFANHMPAVIAGQHDAAARGKRHASRYYVTLFDADRDGEHAWDGMAQLWWDRPPRPPAEPLATTPTDTFQQKVLPHVPWATTEYVILDGSEHLPVEPLTLNAPFPCTRSGFYQLSFLVKARPDTDFDAFFAHWLGVHVPNVKATMERAGGFRYVVSHSLDPRAEPLRRTGGALLPRSRRLGALSRADPARRHGAVGRSRGDADAGRAHAPDRPALDARREASASQRRYTPKYRASGWCKTSAETDASGSIMSPSVSSTPMSSGRSSAKSSALAGEIGAGRIAEAVALAAVARREARPAALISGGRGSPTRRAACGAATRRRPRRSRARAPRSAWLLR